MFKKFKKKIFFDTIQKIKEKIGNLKIRKAARAIETINILDDLPLDLETFFEGRTPKKIAVLIENGGESEKQVAFCVCRLHQRSG